MVSVIVPKIERERKDDLFLCVFVRTKKLIVDVIRIQPGEALPEILETLASPPQVTSSVLPSFLLTHLLNSHFYVSNRPKCTEMFC